MLRPHWSIEILLQGSGLAERCAVLTVCSHTGYYKKDMKQKYRLVVIESVTYK